MIETATNLLIRFSDDENGLLSTRYRSRIVDRDRKSDMYEIVMEMMYHICRRIATAPYQY